MAYRLQFLKEMAGLWYGRSSFLLSNWMSASLSLLLFVLTPLKWLNQFVEDGFRFTKTLDCHPFAKSEKNGVTSNTINNFVHLSLLSCVANLRLVGGAKNG